VQAIILSAGEGTRLRPLTYTKPKVMLPIANKPILEHVIVELRKAGIKDVILVVGYRDEVIRNHFKDGSDWDINITYVSQKVQLGTADALKSAMHLIDDEFIYVVDDWNWPEVQQGTLKSIAKNGMEILFKKEITYNGTQIRQQDSDPHDQVNITEMTSDGWWNGIGIFVLKKNGA